MFRAASSIRRDQYITQRRPRLSRPVNYLGPDWRRGVIVTWNNPVREVPEIIDHKRTPDAADEFMLRFSAADKALIWVWNAARSLRRGGCRGLLVFGHSRS